MSSFYLHMVWRDSLIAGNNNIGSPTVPDQHLQPIKPLNKEQRRMGFMVGFELQV
jgi:hypothetical protein